MKEKSLFIMRKILGVVFIAVILFCAVMSCFVWEPPIKIVMLMPLKAFLMWSIVAGFCESGLLCLAFYVLQYVVLIYMAIMSHVAYFKKKKWMRRSLYAIILLDSLLCALMSLGTAFALDILLLFVVRYMIPVWAPYREKTIYDWDVD